MSASILSYGEILVEFRRAESERPLFAMDFAGDSLNAIAAAAFAGATCRYRTAIGKDMYMRSLEQRLAGLPVEFELERDSEAQNGIYFVSNDESGERQFQYYRKGSAASRYAARAKVPERFSEKCLFLSGITQALSPEWRNFVPALFKAARSQGLVIAYDINFRAKLWSRNEAANALGELLPLLDILFISVDDRAVFADVGGAGPKLVVERLGSAGCAWQEKGGERLSLAAPAVKAVDTSGAGDVFAGTFLAHWLNGSTVTQAAERAVDMASRHTTYPGALPRRS